MEHAVVAQPAHVSNPGKKPKPQWLTQWLTLGLTLGLTVARDNSSSRRSRIITGLQTLRRRLSGDGLRAGAPETCEIEFVGHGQGSVAAGLTLLGAARQLDVDLSHYCGGTCSCGTCRVEIQAGAASLSQPSPNEAMVLGAERVRAGDRLACQARVLGPVVVRVPDWF